jgi:galactose-1-phosphate uridylyltransferase
MAQAKDTLLQEYAATTAPFSVNGGVRTVTYLTRVDPLSGTVAKISEERARRRVGISTALEIRPIGDCDFCRYQERTPKEHVQHACGAVSVPNLYPWEKYDWITIYPPFGNHKLLLAELYFEDLERMIESSYDLALRCASDPEVTAFMDFTNWGPFAGASQQHPHSQRKSVTSVLDPRQAEELTRCKELAERYSANPFDLYAEEERSRGLRVIYDGEILIAAAFAPTCPHEILVFPKEEIAHILQTSESQRKGLVQPTLGVFKALFFYLGVTDLNVAVHMAPFRDMDVARSYYRWHMHILPRRSRLPVDRAGAELGFGINIIDTLPESTADLLRRWYREGPHEELLATTEKGHPNPVLLGEFRRLRLSGTGP